MRVVIDLQGAQAENRTRGIGRYALSFTKAFIKHRGEIEVFIVLNALFGESIDDIREALHGLLPDSHIHTWVPNANVASLNADNLWGRQAAELVREAFIASLDPDLVLITSLFEGLVDDAVTSIKCLNSTIPTAAIVYDLIPLINPETYLSALPVRQWYESKLKHLRRADLLLAISNSSRSEALRYLGFAPDQVVNISTAIDTEHYRPIANTQPPTELLQRLAIARDFVMYTGGIDPRKNIDGLIIAYANLPAEIRTQHQLVIVCKVQPEERDRLLALAKTNGLNKSDVCITGYVSDDDLLALYNACKLFIFPSLHEGFGLPALEAMACAKPVIASNTSSLPEVLGNPEALFDPFDLHSITAKLEEVLTNEALRTRLTESAVVQAASFSWDQTAITAVGAVHKAILQLRATSTLPGAPRQPRLAYVSPLPPARSGISDYSAELLPELAAHYQIDVIVAQDSASPADVGVNYNLRSVAWFEANAHLFDRVIYHFGNSTFHSHMFQLIEKIPGTVVLHDFFLSGVVANMEVHQGLPGFWVRALYHGHGYRAVSDRLLGADTADAVWKYSCNLGVLQQAEGIIVHSHYSIRLAQQWYGENSGLKWAEIPLLRTPHYPTLRKRAESRSKLGFSKHDFVVCSYGLLGPSKLNDRLLEAWLDSPLSKDKNCYLVYVGQNSDGEFGDNLLKRINASGCRNRIKITGWADADTFKSYLEAADAAVQLRTLSRGETSAAVLDCLNYGIATIVNANGSMSDIPDTSLIKLPDAFSNEELTEALVLLRSDSPARERIGAEGQKLIHIQHSPRACAALYHKAIERFHTDSFHSTAEVVSSIATRDKTTFSIESSVAVATSIDQSLKPSISKHQLLVDISELVNRDAKSGIQRVVRNILQIWLKNPPGNYRVEPVYATEHEDGYRYARHFTLGFMGCPGSLLADEPVVYHNGDHFIGLDLQPVVVPRQRSALAQMRRRGVKVQFVVYDLLLKKLSECFPPGASDVVDQWLETVSQADGAICISKAVADEMAEWLSANRQPSKRPYSLSWFHLGADINEPRLTQPSASATRAALSDLGSRTSFLMVGTLEPRKGHAQVLDAFEALWAKQHDVNLLIVGKQGWMVEALVERLNNHPEKGKRLFWFQGVDDDHLCALYEHADALIAASLGEGFGLPLIEAAQYKLPLIVRDIPVFREVAGAHAFYFKAEQGVDLSSQLADWLGLHAEAAHPKSEGMPWMTWEESAQQLFKAL
ncbi:glycosyltransferase [Pseudomonas sp. NPDC089401]|uniref:glycosyltransferase n=1 Tax=Pseudomonas sp. NPDC089401 TaxID=3364462 RepID=UPI003807ADB3